MKVAIIFSAVLALALALPVEDKDAYAVKSEFDNIGVDGFKYAYETSNGIAQEESAVLKNVGTDAESIAVSGFFKYIGADGVEYKVTYVADENGFQPQGAHLPVA